MATIPSPVWVKSEEDRCCAGCISLGTQQWKLTDYKARMTRLDGVGLSFKDPSKATLSGKWCEKGWEVRASECAPVPPNPPPRSGWTRCSRLARARPSWTSSSATRT